MVSIRYAYESAPAVKTARARVDGVNASYKDLANVCSNVRGRRADKALEFLVEAAAGERPVRYFNYNKRRGHVKALGGKKGGWPVKSCRIVRDLLANAIANAEGQKMGPTKIAHIQANKQEIYGRMSPKGKRIRQDYETAFVEIVLVELQGVKAEKKAAEAPKGEAKKEAKPAPAKAEEKKGEAKPVAEGKPSAAKSPVAAAAANNQ